MPLETIGTGDVITEAYLDSIAEQVVIVCTSTTRPGSPPEGMTIYETNTGFYRVYDGSAWRTYPFGVLWESEATQTGPPIINNEVIVNGSEVTWTAQANQRYWYLASFTVNGDANDAFTIRVKRDGSNVGIARYTVIRNSLVAETVSFHTSFTVTAGSHTMGVYIQGDATTNGTIFAGGDFSLAHMGNVP